MTLCNEEGHPVSPARYERVTFNHRTIFLQITNETDAFLTGLHVDKEGDAVKVGKVDMTTHLVEKALVTKRTPYRMNMFYGWLEKVTE